MCNLGDAKGMMKLVPQPIVADVPAPDKAPAFEVDVPSTSPVPAEPAVK